MFPTLPLANTADGVNRDAVPLRNSSIGFTALSRQADDRYFTRCKYRQVRLLADWLKAKFDSVKLVLARRYPFQVVSVVVLPQAVDVVDVKSTNIDAFRDRAERHRHDTMYRGKFSYAFRVKRYLTVASTRDGIIQDDDLSHSLAAMLIARNKLRQPSDMTCVANFVDGREWLKRNGFPKFFRIHMGGSMGIQCCSNNIIKWRSSAEAT